MTVGEKIALCRKERKLSQSQLAKRVQTTAQNISQYERGIRNPKWHTLLKLAEALEVSIFELADDDMLDAHTTAIIDTKIDTSKMHNLSDINDPEELKKIIFQQNMTALSDKSKLLQNSVSTLVQSEQDERLQVLYEKIGMLSENKRKILEELLDAMLETTADNAASEE